MVRWASWRVILLGIALGIVAPNAGQAVTALAPAAKAPPAVRVHQLTVSIRVESDGRSISTTHAEMLATNDAAAMKLGQISISYDASLGTLDVISAYTLKKDGTKIPVDTSAIYDQLAPGAASVPMFTEYHVKTIIFPQFKAGDTAIYTVRLATKTAIFPGQFWTGEMFPHTTAYDSVDETIDAPDSVKLKIDTYAVDFSKQRDGGRTVYHWHYSAPTPEAPETVAIPQIAKIPHFFVSTFDNYRALGAAYATAAAPKLAVTPTIQALADKITKGASDQRTEAEAIYDWVRTNIRYVAVELGSGVMVPHSAQTVLTNGYGDCKDHVTLLGALLKAKGIASEGVLINGDTDYELTAVPTFVGLDHIITYLPKFDLYLDSTASVAPFGVLPFSEYGKPIVFAAPDHAGRGTMPVLAPGQATSYTKTQSQLSADGHWSGTTTTEGTGPYEIELRQIGLLALAAGPDVLASKLMTASYFGSHPSGSVTAPPPMQSGGNYTVTARFNGDGWDKVTSGAETTDLPGGLRVLGAAGDGPMGALFGSQLSDDADYPCYSVSNREDISLTAPSGMRFAQVPEDVHVTTSNIRFDVHWTLVGNTITAHREFISRIGQPLCTAAIREANKAALKEISGSYDATLSLEPVNGPKSAAESANLPAFAAAIARLREDPRLAAMMEDARVAWQHGDLSTTIAILSNILNQPDLPVGASYPVLYGRSMAYTDSVQFRKALADIQAALAILPGDNSLLRARAELYFELGNWSNALADCNTLLAANPADLATLHWKANILFEEGHYRQAIRNYTSELQLLPDANTYFLRAISYLRLGQRDSAEADVMRAKRAGDENAQMEFDEIIQMAPLVISNEHGVTQHASPHPSSETLKSEGVEFPTAANLHTAHDYPPLSHRLGEEGVTVVGFTIEPDGSVASPEIVTPTAFPSLDAAALAAVKTWRYHPAMRNGRPIAIYYKAKVTWLLKGF